MFHSFAWPPALFVVAVVVSIIGFYFSRVIAFVLLLALVLYLGINWNVWGWVSWLFWIVWVLGLAGYILWVVFNSRRHRYTRHSGGIANGASYVALGITLVMVIASLLSLVNWPSTRTAAIPRSSTTSTGSGSGSASNQGTSSRAQAQAQQQVTVNGLYEPTTSHLMQVGQSLGYHVMVLNDGVATPVFAYGSMAPVGNGGRLWSDAVNKPLATRTSEAEQAVVSFDPAQAAMVMNGLGRQSVGDKTVAQLNPWMVAQGSPSTISTWAQNCRTDNVAVHLQCAQTMSLAAELLARLQDKGVVVSDSVWNYHLAGGGLVVGKVPAFELNRVQEHQNHFLELALTEKTGGCWLRIGFNVGAQSVNGGDQRMAGLPCVAPGTAAATPRTSSSTTTSTHRTTPPSGTHTTPSSPPGVPFTLKPAQSWNCMINAGPGCKPNGGHQAVQNNTTSHVNTGGTPGAPATAPTPAPVQTTAPSGGSTGPGGTTGGTQPTNSPQVGVTGTPPPGTFTPPSGG